MEKRTAKTQCIAIVGLPASGKTSIGSALARRLGLPFVDLDEQIVAAEGRSIAEIFKVEGEASFRQLESVFLNKATSGSKAVVSTGGGCVLSSGNRSLLRERCTVVWLDLSPEFAANRAEAGGTKSGKAKAGSGKAVGRNVQVPDVRPLLAGGGTVGRYGLNQQVWEGA